ncbi:hypothetical protein SAMN05518847_107116 [Paenibacillus sp. OV219]|nr:hypothetical protein SAMN05518847_107116 [Paenibacillus sp. OV219]
MSLFPPNAANPEADLERNLLDWLRGFNALIVQVGQRRNAHHFMKSPAKVSWAYFALLQRQAAGAVHAHIFSGAPDGVRQSGSSMHSGLAWHTTVNKGYRRKVRRPSCDPRKVRIHPVPLIMRCIIKNLAATAPAARRAILVSSFLLEMYPSSSKPRAVQPSSHPQLLRERYRPIIFPIRDQLLSLNVCRCFHRYIIFAAD